MDFSRHAKNQLRRNQWSEREAVAVILDPVATDADESCNPRYVGYIRGALVRVVVAADDPNVVITVHLRRHL
ncbi:MAG TPA: hypothetical protein VFI17_05505 [Solirubrobacterales bacterium]|nr:hypothetical protein [Solirubrobacterales bacterium]